MPTVRDIFQSEHPQWSAPVTPIRPQAVSGPTAVQFTPPLVFEDDDLQAAGDDYRDRQLIESLIVDDDSPHPWDLA